MLHTVASLRPETGGPARSVPGLATALAEAGLEVHLWSGDPAGRSIDGVTLHTGTLGAALDALGALDLIHDHGLWLPGNHQVAQQASQRGIPRIVSPRGMLEPWALQHKKWKKRLAWCLYQRRDLHGALGLHATAASEADQFRKLGLARPIGVVPNGVDAPPALSAPPADRSVRTALFLSRIHAKKGLPMLVEAWAALRPAGWRMRVVGPDEGGHREEVQAAVKNAGLSAAWSFDEALEGDAKWRAIAEADLFVLPSFSENFGIAVAEALAAGVPVVTTTGAPWQGLLDHRCGWWVAPETIPLTDALRSAFATPAAELAAMGARGREWMEKDFTWRGIGRQMAAFYQEALGRR